MGAGASASVEDGRTLTDGMWAKLDEKQAGQLTLAELAAAVTKLSVTDEQIAAMAQKKWSMFGDAWDFDADEDDPAKTVTADDFALLMQRIYPHLTPAPSSVELSGVASEGGAEDQAALKLQCAARGKQARSAVESKRAENAAAAPPAKAADLKAQVAALPTLPASKEAPAALGSARLAAPAPADMKAAGERPSSAELVMERPQTAKKRKPIKLIMKDDAAAGPETTAVADAAAPASAANGKPLVKDPAAHAAVAGTVADPALA